MSALDLPGTGDYATAPRTNHANDPRNDARTDLLDRAHQDVFERLLEDKYCRITARDVFEQELRHYPEKIFEILEQLAGFSTFHDPDRLESLTKDCAQIIHNYLEGKGAWLVERRIEEVEEEERREAEEEGAPYYGGEAA